MIFLMELLGRGAFLPGDGDHVDDRFWCRIGGNGGGRAKGKRGGGEGEGEQFFHGEEG